MKYLLDTNICIYMINRKPPAVLQRFAGVQPGDVGVSSITIAELDYGAQKSSDPQRNLRALAQFLLPLVICDFDEAAANAYGDLRAHLERKGAVIGSMDMLIAAHALSLPATIVTNNTREFSRVPKLEIENWTRSST